MAYNTGSYRPIITDEHNYHTHYDFINHINTYQNKRHLENFFFDLKSRYFYKNLNICLGAVNDVL